MTAYYTGMIYLTCFAMGIMALIVHSSDWLDREKQRQFQVIFATVAAAAGAEWLTVFLDGSGPGLRWLHLGVKVLELTIAPFVAVEFLRALDAEKRARQLKWLLIVHGAVEVAAAPFGLIVAFDANNVYVHGELYWIYVAVYFTAALVFIWEGVRFGRRNQAAGGNIMALILVFFRQRGGDAPVQPADPGGLSLSGLCGDVHLSLLLRRGAERRRPHRPAQPPGL